MNLPPFMKNDKVQTIANEELPFLDMKMSLSPKRDAQFGLFQKKGHQLKCVNKGSTYTTGTLCAILSGVLNGLAKLTLRKPIFNSKRMDSVYSNHVNALHETSIVLSRPTHLNWHGSIFRPLCGLVCFYAIFAKKNKKIDPLFNWATSLENKLGI